MATGRGLFSTVYSDARSLGFQVEVLAGERVSEEIWKTLTSYQRSNEAHMP